MLGLKACTSLHDRQQIVQELWSTVFVSSVINWLRRSSGAALDRHGCGACPVQVQKAKSAYLARLRAMGITTDPFERAHRQEQLMLAAQQQRNPSGPPMLGSAPAATTASAGGGIAAPGTLALPAPAAASPQAGKSGYNLMHHMLLAFLGCKTSDRNLRSCELY